MLFLDVFQNFVQPSVEILDLRVDEPVTMLTDLLLAAVCIYALFSIRHFISVKRTASYFRYYFLTLAMAAMSGGILGHALLYRLDPGWRMVSWVFTLLSVALMAHALLEVASPLITRGLKRAAAWMNVIFLIIALCCMFRYMTFEAVKYYTIFGMLLVAGSMSLYIYNLTGQRGLVVLMMGIATGMVASLVYSNQLGLSPWFNHNDISHVVLSFSVLVINRGVVLILQEN